MAAAAGVQICVGMVEIRGKNNREEDANRRRFSLLCNLLLLHLLVTPPQSALWPGIDSLATFTLQLPL
jgi:hypothetical protein